MSLTEVMKRMVEQAEKQRKLERKLLEEIAAVTSLEYAEQAAEVLDSKKHEYSFDGYLTLLEKLIDLLQTGISETEALDAVQAAGFTVELYKECLNLKFQGGEKFDKAGFNCLPIHKKAGREIKK